MKKIIALLLCSISLTFQTVWANNDGGEWCYTSKGVVYNASLYSLHELSNIKISKEAFPNIIVQGESPLYTVYGNSINSDTLTIGQTDTPLPWNYSLDWEDSCREQLKAALHNHINYIESVGGVMTGYAEQNPSRSDIGFNIIGFSYSYVISWDMGDKHHYAKFYLSNGSYIGYYDLEFSDGSDSEKYIPQLNESLISWGQ